MIDRKELMMALEELYRNSDNWHIKQGIMMAQTLVARAPEISAKEETADGEEG